jgi:hypothetical protein
MIGCPPARVLCDRACFEPAEGVGNLTLRICRSWKLPMKSKAPPRRQTRDKDGARTSIGLRAVALLVLLA